MSRTSLNSLRDTLRIVTQTDPNAYGGAYGLTTLLPILHGREDELEAHLLSLDPLASPLAALPALHFSRLHVIRELVYQGPPQVPESLDQSYLIFTTSHDGPPEPLLRALALSVPREQVDAIFGACRGYPGVEDSAAFAAWVLEHKKDNGYMLTPWPGSSVQDVQESLRVQQGFGALVEQSRTLDDAALQAAFRDLMAGGR
jgi:hypothetical protein